MRERKHQINTDTITWTITTCMLRLIHSLISMLVIFQKKISPVLNHVNRPDSSIQPFHHRINMYASTVVIVDLYCLHRYSNRKLGQFLQGV